MSFYEDSFYHTINIPSSWPHLNLVSCKRSRFQIPSFCHSQIQHVNFYEAHTFRQSHTILSFWNVFKWVLNIVKWFFCLHWLEHNIFLLYSFAVMIILIDFGMLNQSCASVILECVVYNYFYFYTWSEQLIIYWQFFKNQ